MALSPMMRQYLDIKGQNPEAILFFRLGDFYEMFFEDAKLVSRLLELTLTGKNCGLEERAPMCGVPFHAADSYIAKLVEQGYSVAICEQLEDPAEAKGMVKRGVVRVVTPGTVTSGAILSEKENNYLAVVYEDRTGVGIAYCDISTGELETTERNGGSGMFEDILNELGKIQPKEVLVSEKTLPEDQERLTAYSGAFLRLMPDAFFAEKAAEDGIRAQFGGISLTALGLEGRPHSLRACGALLSYLLETQKQALSQITACTYYEIGSNMVLDQATIRNLEIMESLFEKRTKGSLLGVLDKTQTAVGGRMLKQWLRAPLNHAEAVNDRLDAVEELLSDPLRLNDLSEALRQVYDFERLSGRVASGAANGKDMIALLHSVRALPEIRGALEDAQAPLLRGLCQDIHDLQDLGDDIERLIVEDPPLTVREGGLIRPGADPDLDALNDSIKDARAWISGLEAKEKERTGITHLKVGYNKVFGYYIEISRSNLDLVPDNYIRKQTLVGAERFITPELKEMEGLVLNAETRINKLEYEIFTALRARAGSRIREIQETSKAVAAVDVLHSFALVSLRNNYVRPAVDESDILEIRRGRHPVIEQMTESSLFVANDTYADRKDASMLIITGPNMSGKSTYMRQTALIILMAQIGCFVPADKARIGIVDRIFTRIGASDNLSRGQSTFFVEMSELAYILRNAGPRSFIVLDEIGRGTSTYDGLSIAWATVEYLCSEKRRIRTMFATHYHELTILQDQLPGVVNLNVDVSDDHGEIVFLHKIVPGSASRSYGVHVARLAGVPLALLENAEGKLARLEAEGSAESVRDAFTTEPDAAPGGGVQLSLFASDNEPIIQKLRGLDLMEVTPSQAIRILEDLKELLP